MNILARVEEAAEVSRIRHYDTPITAYVDWANNKPLGRHSATRVDFASIIWQGFCGKVWVFAHICAKQVKRMVLPR